MPSFVLPPSFSTLVAAFSCAGRGRRSNKYNKRRHTPTFCSTTTTSGSASCADQMTTPTMTTHDDECPICFEVLASKIRLVTPCGHSACLECFVQLDPKVCPLCRVDLSTLFPKSMTSGPTEHKKDVDELRQRRHDEVIATTSDLVTRMNEIFPVVAFAWDAITTSANDDDDDTTTDSSSSSSWRMMMRTSRVPTSGNGQMHTARQQQSPSRLA